MRSSAGASFYYTTDAFGSVVLLADSNQAKAATCTYDAWEAPLSQELKPATTHTSTFTDKGDRHLLHRVRSSLLKRGHQAVYTIRSIRTESAI